MGLRLARGGVADEGGCVGVDGCRGATNIVGCITCVEVVVGDEFVSAAAPRWRGGANRLEVWYATLSDPVTGAGLWVHYETVAPVVGVAYRHGWISWFPADGPPGTDRFGPQPGPLSNRRSVWFDIAGGYAGSDGLSGRVGAVAWELGWKDAGRPLWTFPRMMWEHELLPGAQVVVAPTAEFSGWFTVGDIRRRVDGWRGAVAHIYGHGNAQRWGWLHADLGGSDVLEVVSAVSRWPGLRRLAPVTFVRARIDGRDWPAGRLPALRLCTTLGARHWRLAGRIGRHPVSVRVDQPADRCVRLRYIDPDGDTAVCTNTERADVHIGIGDRRWSLLGRGHAEVGLRGTEAPAPVERTLG